MIVARVLAKLKPGGAQLSLLRVGRRLTVRDDRTRLLVGDATDAGNALARQHGGGPGSARGVRDLQWRCDPGFAAWLAQRLGGADVVHTHMSGAWWAAWVAGAAAPAVGRAAA